MKKLFLISLVAATTSCSKSNTQVPVASNNNSNVVESGIVKGKITDTKGNPIANATVVVENTIFWGTYVYVTTGNDGTYKTSVPNGSWNANVQIKKLFQGQEYNFQLHPDNANAFAGTTGAIRNFSWQLNGAKPGGGFYGSNVAVYPEPGSALMMSDVELSLSPDGPLIDGSSHQTFSKTPADIGGGEDGINDIPIGKYTITARNKSTHQPLQIRLRNTGEYQASVTGIFEAGFTGSTTYQIVVQVK